MEEILKQHFKFALGINFHNNNEENKKLFFLSSVDGTLPVKSNNAPQHCEIYHVGGIAKNVVRKEIAGGRFLQDASEIVACLHKKFEHLRSQIMSSKKYL